jgi:hypothetical protein
MLYIPENKYACENVNELSRPNAVITIDELPIICKNIRCGELTHFLTQLLIYIDMNELIQTNIYNIDANCPLLRFCVMML